MAKTDVYHLIDAKTQRHHLKYPVQAQHLQNLTTGLRLREIVAGTGIERTRLCRLLDGSVELTLREAYLLSKSLGTDLLDPKFVEEHLYSAPLTKRTKKVN